jgi:uncharacterized protein YndB with AHSA1/START domain
MTNIASTDPIVQEISINAPADRIFEALTNPQQLVRWWGIEGRFQTRHMESDLRRGGKWTMSGDGMNGVPFEIKGEYREVKRPSLLVFTWLPSWQPNATESLVRVDLTEKDGLTNVRLTHSGLSAEGRTSHQGWQPILGLLKDYVTATNEAR